MAVETRLLGPVERALYLSTMKVLSDLDPDSLATLANHVEEYSFQEGESIIRPGQPVRTAHIFTELTKQLAGAGGAQ